MTDSTTRQERYPLSVTALRAMLGPERPGELGATTAFVVGPHVLRAPPGRVRAAQEPDATVGSADDARVAPPVDELIGELVDMVLVTADETASGRPEVHLQFKGDVVEGLHLRLVKGPLGLDATFVVRDAAARRAVADHVDALVERLRGRGFAITNVTLTVGG